MKLIVWCQISIKAANKISNTSNCTAERYWQGEKKLL